MSSTSKLATGSPLKVDQNKDTISLSNQLSTLDIKDQKTEQKATQESAPKLSPADNATKSLVKPTNSGDFQRKNLRNTSTFFKKNSDSSDQVPSVSGRVPVSNGHYIPAVPSHTNFNAPHFSPQKNGHINPYNNHNYHQRNNGQSFYLQDRSGQNQIHSQHHRGSHIWQPWTNGQNGHMNGNAHSGVDNSGGNGHHNGSYQGQYANRNNSFSKYKSNNMNSNSNQNGHVNGSYYNRFNRSNNNRANNSNRGPVYFDKNPHNNAPAAVQNSRNSNNNKNMPNKVNNQVSNNGQRFTNVIRNMDKKVRKNETQTDSKKNEKSRDASKKRIKFRKEGQEKNGNSSKSEKSGEESLNSSGNSSSVDSNNSYLSEGTTNFSSEYAGRPQEIMCTKTLQVQNKRYYFDIKKHEYGTFLKLAETGLTKSRMVIPVYLLTEFSKILTNCLDKLKNLPKFEVDRIQGGCSGDHNDQPQITSAATEHYGEILERGKRRYYFNLKENSRGRYLRIKATGDIPQTFPGVRKRLTSQDASRAIILPSIGIVDFLNVINELKMEYPVDIETDQVAEVDRSIAEHGREYDRLLNSLRITCKKFRKIIFVDAGENARGTFARITEQHRNKRESTTIPSADFKKLGQWFIEADEKLSDHEKLSNQNEAKAIHFREKLSENESSKEAEEITLDSGKEKTTGSIISETENNKENLDISQTLNQNDKTLTPRDDVQVDVVYKTPEGVGKIAEKCG